MGGDSRKPGSRKSLPEPSTSTSSSGATSSSEDQVESSSKLRKQCRLREEEHKSKRSRKDHERRRKDRRRREREKHKRKEKKKRRFQSDESLSGSDTELENPEDVVKYILEKFPAVAGDLEELLLMIDQGQAVDIRGLSERSLVKHLRKLFTCLNLKENGDQVFLLPHKATPTLKVVGPIIRSQMQPQNQLDHLDSQEEVPLVVSESRHVNKNVKYTKEDSIVTRRNIGPEMPSAELLAAAAKLTAAEAELREAELDGDNELFIGPPPPAMVKEAESANEAERFEEISRIIGAEEASPYDVLGVNINTSAENMKKRYWKLSLMVHPDKCSHPQANQAFAKLNKAFKDLQDPDKRKALDDKIKLKKEQESFQAELKAMREAAQWRRLQGVVFSGKFCLIRMHEELLLDVIEKIDIKLVNRLNLNCFFRVPYLPAPLSGISMEGDDILLAELDVKVAPKREEWMTTLPPERKPGVSMHSTKFSKSSKGRGDTSVWTDTPSERAQKAKMNYLEAYNEAAALASNEKETRKMSSEAELVDQYNKAKRSKSLVEKHQEASAKSRVKKRSKQEQESGKQEWEGNHPWKPWDREKDLTAGRQSVNLDRENMTQGLSSRFSSSSFQRNFL